MLGTRLVSLSLLVVNQLFLGPFPARRSGNLPLDVAGVLACALPLMPQRHCAVDATPALHDDSAARRTDENGYGILNQCHVGDISFTVLQRPFLLALPTPSEKFKISTQTPPMFRATVSAKEQ